MTDTELSLLLTEALALSDDDRTRLRDDFAARIADEQLLWQVVFQALRKGQAQLSVVREHSQAAAFAWSRPS